MQTANIEALLSEVCQAVGGDWLLVGGSLVMLEYDGARSTEDIDLVQIKAVGKTEIKAQDELFQAALRLGMDPEQVNSAAKFFVSELKGWENELRIFRQGLAGRIFRPSLVLFIALKLRRATEIDLSDIVFAIRKEGKNEFDEPRFRALASDKILKNFDRLRDGLGI